MDGVNGAALARRLARNTGPRGDGEAEGGGHIVTREVGVFGAVRAVRNESRVFLQTNIAAVCTDMDMDMGIDVYLNRSSWW